MSRYQTKQGEAVTVVGSEGAQCIPGAIVMVGGVERVCASIRVIDGRVIVGLKKQGKSAPKQTIGQYRAYLSSGAYDRDNGAY